MRKLTRIGLLASYADTTTLDTGAYDPNVAMLPQASGGSNYLAPAVNSTTVLDPAITTSPATNLTPPAPVYTFNPTPAPAPAPAPAFDPIQAYTAPAPPPAPATAPAGTITNTPAADGTNAPAGFIWGEFIKANPLLVGLGLGFVILVVSKKKRKKRKNAR